jgi:hypothetical protein
LDVGGDLAQLCDVALAQIDLLVVSLKFVIEKFLHCVELADVGL